jgi:hypothetical protein
MLDMIGPGSHPILAATILVATLPLAINPSLGDEPAEQLVLATYKLSNESSTATGTAVRFDTAENESQIVIITANHVLRDMKGDFCVLVARTARDDGMYARNELRIPIRDGGRDLWLKHAQHDLAALPVPKDIEVVSVPSDCLIRPNLVSRVHSGDAVRLGVFPEQAEANDAGFPMLRAGSIASFPLVPVQPHPLFLVDTTTWTGDSGGPVMHQTLSAPDGGPLIIGIVRGMRSVTDTTRESRFVERRTHYPLGLSEVLQAALIWDFVPGEWQTK